MSTIRLRRPLLRLGCDIPGGCIVGNLRRQRLDASVVLKRAAIPRVMGHGLRLGPVPGIHPERQDHRGDDQKP